MACRKPLQPPWLHPQCTGLTCTQIAGRFIFQQIHAQQKKCGKKSLTPCIGLTQARLPLPPLPVVAAALVVVDCGQGDQSPRPSPSRTSCPTGGPMRRALHWQPNFETGQALCGCDSFAWRVAVRYLHRYLVAFYCTMAQLRHTSAHIGAVMSSRRRNYILTGHRSVCVPPCTWRRASHTHTHTHTHRAS
jgi:hypothetical protein